MENGLINGLLRKIIVFKKKLDKRNRAIQDGGEVIVDGSSGTIFNEGLRIAMDEEGTSIMDV